jgi:hypothetical protein
MKNILPAIVVVLVIGLSAWYFTSNTNKETTAPVTAGTSKSEIDKINSKEPPAPGSSVADKKSDTYADEEDPQVDEDIKPATEVYKNADDALEALRAASKSYDDSVLEQFSEPDPSCSWCENLYSSLNRMIFSPDISNDEKSFYAEVLAISGRVSNIKTLVEAIKSSAKPEDADVYSEALELSLGKDDVTEYLGSELKGANDTLRESLVAALTNQNSRLAAETLYKNTVERGDADGYYSSGIGLGEFIPDEEALPFLQDALLKHDQYSHLAAKALLNSGADGLRMVLDGLESSKDPDFDRKMLKDAVDHVNYDEEIEELLRKRLETAKQPAAREFIEEALKSFSTDDTARADDAGEEEKDN